jgi:uncharacterized membrane protein
VGSILPSGAIPADDAATTAEQRSETNNWNTMITVTLKKQSPFYVGKLARWLKLALCKSKKT